MSKKQKKPGRQNKEFSSNPLSDLRGLTVSTPPEEKNPPAEKIGAETKDVHGSFSEAMERLGVKPFSAESVRGDGISEDPPATAETPQSTDTQTDEEQFLQAMGELQVNFSDQIPTPSDPPIAGARRMKQLKQGKLVPEASLDLHGLQSSEVAEKLRFFLQDAGFHGRQTLLIITGKGLHSVAGEPVLRNEAERFLAAEGRKWVSEWGRAPKKYGGAGALIIFLRKS